MVVKLIVLKGAPPGEEHHLEDGERVERLQPLDPGHYWRAKHALKDREIPEGCVLLLQRIKRVDDKPHAVQLAGHPLLHPDSTFEFLVHDFLNQFDPEPNGAAIRQKEMAEVQAQIAEQQRDLLNFQEDPTALLEDLRRNPKLSEDERRGRGRDDEKQLPATTFDFKAGLPDANFRPSTSFVAMADGNDQETTDLLRRKAENQAILAKRRAELIAAKTTAIAETVQKLTPFYEEMGAVALAQSQDALDMYGKLKSGLATLGLYTGKDVEVTDVRGGEGAPADEPIYIFQALLFMDEESLVNLSEGGADFRNLKDFVEKLRKDDVLLERLLPCRRGVAAMRYTHEEKNYGDEFINLRMNEENSKCFLIVRNGDRVYLVHSSLEKLKRLFPTQSDLDEPFTRGGWWRGVESERITIEDVKFSEARSEFDDIVLHYRRILILIAGLYDRERRVIGDIAALSGKHGLALLSLPIQQEVFRPVSDEERALSSGRPDFYKWLAEKNSIAQSGSRLLCNWRSLMTSDSAPGAVERVRYGSGNSHDSFRYDPVKKFEIAVAEREKDEIVVRAKVKGNTRYKEREFNARVSVTAWEERGGRDDFGYLCLDDVRPEEINYYVNTRHHRRGYIKYVPLLVAAREAIEADLKREAPLREELRRAVYEGRIAIEPPEVERSIETVIRHWRAAHRGAPAPTPKAMDYLAEVKVMLHQLWVLAGHGRDRRKMAEEIATAEGRLPLRLSISGRSARYLYATPLESEKEDLLGPHPWVVRLRIEEKKTKAVVVDRRHVVLPKLDAKEEVLAEWAEAKDWVEPKIAHELSYDETRALRNLGSVSFGRASRWLQRMSDQEFDQLLDLVKADTRSRSTGYIRHGYLFFPLAVARNTESVEHWVDGKRKAEERHSYYVGGISIRTVDALYVSGTDAQRKKIVDWFHRYYRAPKNAIESLGKKSAVFVYRSVNEAPDAWREEICGIHGEHAGKGRAWIQDLVDFAESIKKHYVHRKPDSASIVIKFDDAAAKVYRGLKGIG